METYLLFGLLCYTIFAFASTIDKYMMNQQYQPITTGIFRTLFNGVILCTIGLLFFQIRFYAALILWALIPAAFFAFGMVIYYRFLKTKNISELTPLYQSFDILFIFLGSIIILHERVQWYNYGGIVLILIGVYFVVSENGLKAPRLDKSFLPLLILIPMDLAYAMFLKTMLGTFDPVPFAIAIYFLSSFMLVGVQLLSKKEPFPTIAYLKPKLKVMFSSSLFGGISVFLFYSALSMGNASKIYPLAGLNFIAVFFLAVLVLKEKFYWHRLLGTLIAFGGIFLILM